MATTSSLLDSTVTTIKNMQQAASDSLGRLEDVASLPYLSWFDMADQESFEPKEVSKINDIGSVAALEKVSIPVIDTIDQADLDKYRTHLWQGANLDSLQTRLMVWIESGGVGISAATQTAIFDQGRERDLQTLRDRMDLAGARTGARGFRYANSMTRTLQNQALTEYDQKKADLSREIVKIIADMAQRNVQFALEKDIAIEALHSDFTTRYAGMFIEINRTILDRYRIEQAARVAEFEGELKRLDFEVQIQLRQSTLDADHQGRLLEAWKSRTMVMLERAKAQIQQAETANNVKFEAIKSMANVYIQSIQNLQGSAISLDVNKPK